jgi:hypothetical protein
MSKLEARRIFQRVMQTRGAPFQTGRVISDFCPHRDAAQTVGWLRGVTAALGVQVGMGDPVTVVLERMVRDR